MWSCRYCRATQSPTQTPEHLKKPELRRQSLKGWLSNCVALFRFAGENEQSGLLLKTTFCAELASKLKEPVYTNHQYKEEKGSRYHGDVYNWSVLGVSQKSTALKGTVNQDNLGNNLLRMKRSQCSNFN